MKETNRTAVYLILCNGKTVALGQKTLDDAQAIRDILENRFPDYSFSIVWEVTTTTQMEVE